MSRPQYVDIKGRPLATAPKSLWDRILGTPQYLTPSEPQVSAADDDRPRARHERRRADEQNDAADNRARARRERRRADEPHSDGE